jgi:hypothetical protein
MLRTDFILFGQKEYHSYNGYDQYQCNSLSNHGGFVQYQAATENLNDRNGPRGADGGNAGRENATTVNHAQ